MEVFTSCLVMERRKFGLGPALGDKLEWRREAVEENKGSFKRG